MPISTTERGSFTMDAGLVEGRMVNSVEVMTDESK
jgi:hypothetical protein